MSYYVTILARIHVILPVMPLQLHYFSISSITITVTNVTVITYHPCSIGGYFTLLK